MRRIAVIQSVEGCREMMHCSVNFGRVHSRSCLVVDIGYIFSNIVNARILAMPTRTNQGVSL